MTHLPHVFERQVDGDALDRMPSRAFAAAAAEACGREPVDEGSRVMFESEGDCALSASSLFTTTSGGEAISIARGWC